MLVRLASSVLAVGCAVAICCAGAVAGEVRSTNPAYANGHCQSYVADPDCYHYVTTVNSNHACVAYVARKFHLNYNQALIMYTQYYTCRPVQPSGRVVLKFYVPDPHECKANVPFYGTPAAVRAKNACRPYGF